MPLTSPASRHKIHTRRVTCEGFRRDDGHLDIEGHITDVKTYEVPNSFRDGIPAGVPIHDMSIRLTVDDDLTILAVEAITDSGPYAICPDITVNFQRLVGIRIGPGWRKKVLSALGGAEGCTHLVELLWTMATTAYQTLYGENARKRREAGEEEPKRTGRPPLLNSCHAFGESSPVVKDTWPEFYKDPA